MVELHFCERCGRAIPDAEVEGSLVLAEEGRVCGLCLDEEETAAGGASAIKAVLPWLFMVAVLAGAAYFLMPGMFGSKEEGSVEEEQVSVAGKELVEVEDNSPAMDSPTFPLSSPSEKESEVNGEGELETHPEPMPPAQAESSVAKVPANPPPPAEELDEKIPEAFPAIGGGRADATFNYLKQMRDEYQPVFDKWNQRRPKSYNSAEEFGDYEKVFSHCLKMDLARVDPSLVDINRRLWRLSRDAKQHVTNQTRELNEAGLKERIARQEAFQENGMAPPVANVGAFLFDIRLTGNYDQALERNYRRWQALFQRQDQLEKRWREIELALPEKYPGMAKELRDLLGEVIYRPEQPGLFDYELQISGVPDPVKSAAAARTALEAGRPVISYMSDWAHLISGLKESGSRLFRYQASEFLQLDLDGVHPAIVETIWRELELLEFKDAWLRVEHAEDHIFEQDGLDLRRRSLVVDDRGRSLSEREAIRRIQESRQQILDGWVEAASWVISELPGEKADLEKLISERFELAVELQPKAELDRKIPISFRSTSKGIPATPFVVETSGELQGRQWVGQYVSLEAEWIADPQERPDKGFGSDAFVVGDTLFVSVPNHSKPKMVRGGVLQFRRRNGRWQVENLIMAPNASSGSHFGDQLDLQDGLLFLGGGSSTLNIHRQEDGRWPFHQKLACPDDKRFGYGPLEVSGSWLAVAAVMNDPHSVYLFQQTSSGNWEVHQEFKPDSNHWTTTFAKSLSLDGDWLAIGAPGGQIDKKPTEAVYLFQHNRGKWSKKSVLKKTLGRKERNRFGHAVSLDGDWLMVGCPSGKQTFSSEGFVEVYQRSGNSWRRRQVLTAKIPRVGNDFGYTVSVENGHALIGTYRGGVYQFALKDGKWHEVRKIVPHPGIGPQIGFGATRICNGYAILGTIPDWRRPDPARVLGFLRLE
ncbi:MAG: hypothetical protein DWQ01_09945 [Planctomycetota bacterium]|nr:MAG: hypothetical protein DWQ01_09945 [Planctomycetota bacterium]